MPWAELRRETPQRGRRTTCADCASSWNRRDGSFADGAAAAVRSGHSRSRGSRVSLAGAVLLSSIREYWTVSGTSASVDEPPRAGRDCQTCWRRYVTPSLAALVPTTTRETGPGGCRRSASSRLQTADYLWRGSTTPGVFWWRLGTVST